MKTLLWLDDERNPRAVLQDGSTWLVFSPIDQPFNLSWVKNYDQFVAYIEHNGLPDAICFDHDLGLSKQLEYRAKGSSKRESRRLARETEKTGFDCAKWLVDYCLDRNIDLPLYNIQSANQVGKENIDKLLKNYIKYKRNRIIE